MFRSSFRRLGHQLIKEPMGHEENTFARDSKWETMPLRPTKPSGKKSGKPTRVRQLAPRDVYIRACAENGLSPNSGLIDFLSMYQESSSIEFIDVSRNYLGDKGIIPLLAVVDRCQNLREISLSENGLRNNAIAALCNSAAKHPSLRHIDVSDNYISEGAAVCLQRLLEDNARVCVLGIDNTKIDVEWRLKLRDLVRGNAAAAEAAAAAAEAAAAAAEAAAAAALGQQDVTKRA